MSIHECVLQLLAIIVPVLLLSLINLADRFCIAQLMSVASFVEVSMVVAGILLSRIQRRAV